MEQTPFEAYRKEDGTVGLFLPSIAEAAGLTRIKDTAETEEPDAGADTAETAETEKTASDAAPTGDAAPEAPADAAPKARARK